MPCAAGAACAVAITGAPTAARSATPHLVQETLTVHLARRITRSIGSTRSIQPTWRWVGNASVAVELWVIGGPGFCGLWFVACEQRRWSSSAYRDATQNQSPALSPPTAPSGKHLSLHVRRQLVGPRHARAH